MVDSFDYDVFLSHSSKDKEIVTALAKRLKDDGLRIWYDEWMIDPADNIPGEIEDGLEQSRTLILFISEAGVESKWVKFERFTAQYDDPLNEDQRLLPILLEECEIPKSIRHLRHIDWREQSDEEYYKLLNACLPETTFKLSIQLNGGDYVARWIDKGNRQHEPFTLKPPLGAKEMDELRWYLEKYPQFKGAGDQKRADILERLILKSWGERLFKALFENEVGKSVYTNLIEEAKNNKTAFLTLETAEADFLAQPWEMMRDRKGPLVFQNVVLRRQLRKTKSLKRSQYELPLKVLLIVSRPSDIGFIDPRNSIPPMLEALEQLPKGNATVDFCEPPTLAGLERTLTEARRIGKPYHIVHFDGHGTYLPLTGVGALAFEREDVTTHLVRGTELGDLLVREEVPVVLLEACRTSDLSDKPVFGSVAPALLECGVGSVIAFSHSVHIKAARLLVERFYQELALGASVGQALAEARRGMHADPARFLHDGPDAETVDLHDWFIPQLYQSGTDLTPIVDAKSEANEKTAHDLESGAAASSDTASFSNFPQPPMYKFQGRARELLELERAFREHNAVLLSGMGGMGKTALAREAAAWWLRTGRFEAAVFFSFEGKAGAERALQDFGNALEGPSFSSKSAEDQWKSAVALFKSKKVLWVWDNFESTLPIYQQGEEGESALSFGAEQRALLTRLYRELTADEGKGRILVTCRPEEESKDNAVLPAIKKMTLGGLERPDSLYLLSSIQERENIDFSRPGYERDEIDKLLEKLQDHPLSIELIAPHLKKYTPKKIREEFTDLIASFTNLTAEEERNRSLIASMNFSKKRLSEEAQAVLPYLAWFEGGTFEVHILAFTKIDKEKWESIKNELVSTALIKLEGSIEFPYLRFHPTLPFAAKASDVENQEEMEKRFIELYNSISGAADQMLRGSQPAVGMALMEREEANLRRAITIAYRRGEKQIGYGMVDRLNLYLQSAGRLRERERLVEWAKEQMPEGEALDGADCEAMRQHAWNRFTQGHADEAVRMLQNLISRIENGELAQGEDATIQLAVSNLYLGRIFYSAGQANLAIQPLQQAVALFEQLGEPQQSNLSATLGDLSNAYRYLGKYEEALDTAEKALEISKKIGDQRSIAAGHGRIAQILMMQQRYSEADRRYEEALKAAQGAGDLDLQGSLLQHQGTLQRETDNYDRAVELYQQAIALFQQAGNKGAEMRTCNLLGSVEDDREQLEAAEAWYNRSRELAKALNDQRGLATVCQNIGVLYKTRAEKADDPNTRDSLLHQAVSITNDGLEIFIRMQNQIRAAELFGNLGLFHRMLGELEQAEDNARKALQIHEPLNLPDVYKTYASLAKIARAKGDENAAKQWEAKRDAKITELERLRRGEGSEAKGGGAPEQLVQFVLALAQAIYSIRTNQAELPPDVAEALAQLTQQPSFLGAVGSFLQTVCEGKEIPPVPPGLPPELEKILQALVEQLGE